MLSSVRQWFSKWISRFAVALASCSGALLRFLGDCLTLSRCWRDSGSRRARLRKLLRLLGREQSNGKKTLIKFRKRKVLFARRFYNWHNCISILLPLGEGGAKRGMRALPRRFAAPSPRG